MKLTLTQDQLRELEKIGDALTAAKRYHERRDEMNGASHLATTVRYSPLTVTLQTAAESLAELLGIPAESAQGSHATDSGDPGRRF